MKTYELHSKSYLLGRQYLEHITGLGNGVHCILLVRRLLPAFHQPISSTQRMSYLNLTLPWHLLPMMIRKHFVYRCHPIRITQLYPQICQIIHILYQLVLFIINISHTIHIQSTKCINYKICFARVIYHTHVIVI